MREDELYDPQWDDDEDDAEGQRQAGPDWPILKRRVAERLAPMVEKALREVATRTWGRASRFPLTRPAWQVVQHVEDASWRAYRYVGSAGPDDHRYYELGVVCHLDPAGNLVGYGVDNGADFMGIHDISEYGLRRGLQYIGQQRPQLRRRETPAYDHKSRDLLGTEG